MVSFLDAAYQILMENGHPLSAQEITRQALERDLLVTQGATPESTMGSLLYVDIKKKGSGSRFKRAGPNLFNINDHQIAQPSADNISLKFVQVSKSSRGKKYRNLVPIATAHDRLDQEIKSIRSFLNGEMNHAPTSEKICDWVNLCYNLGLYSEGVHLFSFAEISEVNEWYYERTKKMARLCSIYYNNPKRE